MSAFSQRIRHLEIAADPDDGDFIELTWEGHRLFLVVLSTFDEIEHVAPAPVGQLPSANVRVMVPNVEHCWSVANEIGARIIVPIADREYGLRDFTIADPDGFGVRFATLLPPL